MTVTNTLFSLHDSSLVGTLLIRRVALWNTDEFAMATAIRLLDLNRVQHATLRAVAILRAAVALITEAFLPLAS